MTNPETPNRERTIRTSHSARLDSPDRRGRFIVLFVCCTSLLLIYMDSTVLNVALPSIARTFHASVADLQWTIDGYALVLGCCLLLSGSLADRFGRRRTFQTGLCMFTIASALCSVAPSIDWLIGFRVLQGLGGSMLNPVALSIIRNTFADPKERAQAIGIWGGVMGVGLAFGTVIGGLLVQSAGWRSVFWVNVPIGIGAMFLTKAHIRESRAPEPRRIDLIGQFLMLLATASLTYAVIEAHASGWSSDQTIGLLVVFAGALGAIIVCEPRLHEPLIEVVFFKSVPFTGAAIMAFAAFFAFGGYLFLNTLYLQEARGLSALDAGLCILPIAVMTLVTSIVSGRLIGARGPRIPFVLAGLALTAGSVAMTGITPTTPLVRLLVAYLVFGAGNGLVNPPITNTAVSGMPAARAGVAAAITSTCRQIGGALGVAVVGAAAVAGIHGSLRTSFAEASHIGWWIVTGCAVIVFGVGILTTTQWAQRTAERAQSIFADEAMFVGQVSEVGPPGRAPGT